MAKSKKKDTKRQQLFLLFFCVFLPLMVFLLWIVSLTDSSGFSVAKISSSLSYQEQWDIKPLSREEKDLLNDTFSQTFTYLDGGAKSYNFVSEDGKYVIKFFRMKHLLAKNWISYIPIPKILDVYRFKKVAKRNLMLFDVFESCKIAFEDLRKETGLVYIHLNKGREWKRKIRLIDNQNKEVFVDLDNVEFVVQKKAIPFADKISFLRMKHDSVTACKALHSILELMVERSRKGIWDKEIDKNVDITRNYGFIDDGAVYLDISDFERKEVVRESILYKKDLLKASEKIQEWLQIYYPEIIDDFIKEVDAFLM